MMIVLAGKMHRDLKSANLLLTEDWVTKLCDFGLIRDAREGFGDATVQVGTGTFRAPEVLMCKPYGLPADVFSYGNYTSCELQN